MKKGSQKSRVRVPLSLSRVIMLQTGRGHERPRPTLTRICKVFLVQPKEILHDLFDLEDVGA